MTTHAFPANSVVTGSPTAPERRLAELFDPGTLSLPNAPDDSGVLTARGRIDGATAYAYSTDATRMGGALGAAGARHIVTAIEKAMEDDCPVIGLWHSGGARLADGVESMDGVGRMFAAMTRASGRIFQLSVVLGPAAGAAAYGPALTDVVIMSGAGRLFVTGPDVVQSVTGERVDMEALGGAEPHSRKSGVVHIATATEAEAYARARHLTSLFTRPGCYDLSAAGPGPDPSGLLPESPRRVYDIRPIIKLLLDPTDRLPSWGAFEEFQPKWAPNMVVGLGRLAGRTIGVVANNPLRMGGCLDSLSAEKASRFVRMSDSLGVPLVVLVDVPGYLPGVDQEWGGVLRRGAKLLHAFAEATVPRATLILRKSYGGAYIAMNSRSLGATAVYAWPQAQVAVMSAEAAVGVIHRKTLAAAAEDDRAALLGRLVEEHERVSGGVKRALGLGVIDEVIEPVATRGSLAAALAAAPPGRGSHSNIPL